MHQPTEIIGDFKRQSDMDHAIEELVHYRFSPVEMGMEKTVAEFKGQDKSLDAGDGRPGKVLWQVRDSLKDIREESVLVGGVVALVGIGIGVATTVGIMMLDRVTFAQDPAIFLLTYAAVVMVMGVGLFAWAHHDTKGQYKANLPKGLIRFWVQTRDQERAQLARRILSRNGAHLRT